MWTLGVTSKAKQLKKFPRKSHGKLSKPKRQKINATNNGTGNGTSSDNAVDNKKPFFNATDEFLRYFKCAIVTELITLKADLTDVLDQEQEETIKDIVINIKSLNEDNENGLTDDSLLDELKQNVEN